MAKRILVDYDFSLNELQNGVIHKLLTDPITPVSGQFWFNTTSNQIKYYNGTVVKTVATISDLAGLLSFQGGYNASTNTPNLTTPLAGAVLKGYYYIVTVAGSFFSTNLQIGDTLFANIDDPTVLSDWTIVEGNLQPASETVAGYIEIATQIEADAGADDSRAITPLKLATYLTNLDYTRRFSQTGVSLGTIPGPQIISHNFNTRNVVVSIIDSTTFEQYEVEVEHTTLNAVTLNANGPTVTAIVTIIGK